MTVINLGFGLDALAVYACQRQFFLREKTIRNVAHLGGCYSLLENTLNWIEERSECLFKARLLGAFANKC